MNRLKQLSQDIRLYIVPLLLLFIWVAISAFTALFFRSSITVLRHDYHSGVIFSPKEGLVLQGKEFTGNFIASDDYLGSIGVWIRNNSKEGVKEDEIVFRVKEVGSQDWYYEKVYGGGQFRELNNFPFGFTPIANSKGKRYLYEILSKSGTIKNALTISSGNPSLITQYQFPKKELLTNKGLLIHFLAAKILYGLSSISLVLTLLIYFIFFGFYISTILFYEHLKNKKVFRKIAMLHGKINIYLQRSFISKQFSEDFNKIQFFDILLLWTFLIDIFFIDDANMFLFTILLVLCIGRILIRKFSTSYTFLISFFFLSLCILSLIFGRNIGAEKSAIWVYMFLVFGTLRILFDRKAS